MDKMKTIINYTKIFLVALALEVIFFNMTSYRVLLGKFEKREYSIEELQVLDFGGETVFLEIDNLNIPVGTIHVGLNYEVDDSYDININYSDDTNDTYMSFEGKTIFTKQLKTQYVPCYFSGNVKRLRVEIDKKAYKNSAIQKIVLNEHIPFQFNIERFLMCMLILLLLFEGKNIKILNENFDEKNKMQRIFMDIVTGLIIALTVLVNFGASDVGGYDQYNKYLVDAFANHSLSLLESPTEKFLNYEKKYNTYDRYNDGIKPDKDYKNDVAFYNGKYYVYFGVLPVITVFLPYYLISKKYASTVVVCLIYSIGVIIFLKLILSKILKKYFENKVPLKFALLSLITLGTGCFILYMNGRVHQYEVAVVSALFNVLIGTYFLLRYLDKGKHKYINLAFSALFMALSVACRPTQLICSLILVPFLWDDLYNNIKSIKNNKLNLVKLILAVAIPYAIVAIPLMWYNYARFGSILEFGAKYQLTVNNMIELKSGMASMLVCVARNLFMLPKFSIRFPFIENTTEAFKFYGFMYSGHMLGGIFMLAPICFMCFKIMSYIKIEKNAELKKIVIFGLISAVLIAIVSAIMGGSIQRYCVDYAWLFILIGIIILGRFYGNLDSNESKKIISKIFIILTIYTFCLGIIGGIVSENDYFKAFSKDVYYFIRYSICFWE